MKNRETQYLDFNRLEAISRLAGLLPPDLACRYHALPVAEDGERITVAMADPGDKDAREAIMAVLGPSACFVRADAQVIDSLLAKFWEKASSPTSELLLWASTRAFADEIEAYAEDLATLLGAHLSRFETPKTGNEAYRVLASEVKRTKADIVILGSNEQTTLNRLLEVRPEYTLADRLSTSLLVVRQPCWPIINVLLVLRNEGKEETAVDWTLRFAQPSCADVTVLPLTLPAPVMCDQDPRLSYSIDTLLTSDSKLGKKLRFVAQRLVDSEINGTLRLREEPPIWQIRFELLEKDYDLIVIDCKPRNRLCRWMLGELVNPLLSRTDIPVLITKTGRSQ
jgi:nucleotide-binding universal stress UspA family protein